MRLTGSRTISYCFTKRHTSILLLLLFLIWSNPSQSQEQPVSPLMHSYKKHSQMKASTTYGLEWIPLGPAANGARVEAVQADPENPGTIYVAFGSGGLWKTTNNGMSWKPVFENMPSLGIGDFALASSNPEIIYLGTGESLKKARNFTMPGTGMYRSDDGGETWSHLGLNDSWHIGEISVNPKNPDIVLVAVQGHFWSSNPNRGIYRTEDGGKTWSQVLFINKETGANDVVFSPADPSVAYASMWNNYPSVNGINSGVYKSEDAGKTWKKVMNGITFSEETGRIGVAASYQDKNKAYVFVDQRNREVNEGAGEIYKTEDGGKNWTRTHKKDIMSLAGLGWYFMDIYINPQNDDEIFALGIGLIHSKDGGQNFDYIRGQINHLTPSAAQTLHLDHCEMWINPANPNELLLGNDGGLYHSYDRGNSWLHLNNIPAGEFYDIEVDHQEPYTIYGGTQDNSTVFGPSKEFKPKFNDPWKYLWIDAWSGGDGCITLVDPNDDNTVYFSMQNGSARRLDLKKERSVSIRPRFENKELKIEYNFITPYMLSPHNSNRVYMAGNYVMRSENRGNDWVIISPKLDSIRLESKEETGAGAMAESFFNEGTLYVGTDKGSMYRTLDGGKNWKDISNGLPHNYIRCISPSRHKEGRVYIQQTGLNYDNFKPCLYVSEHFGEEWKPLMNNLPDHPINTILEDPVHENILYAGTYRGVYISENSGKDWAYFGKNLPDASIADIVIEENTKDMIIATHGRGLYKLNLLPVYAASETALDSNILFDPVPAKSPRRRDTHRDIDEQSVEKTPFTFRLDEAEKIKLLVTDRADSTIWSKTIDAQKGYNQYRWDLVVQEEESNLPYHIHFKRYLEPGEYKLQIEGLGWKEQRAFRVSR